MAQSPAVADNLYEDRQQKQQFYLLHYGLFYLDGILSGQIGRPMGRRRM